MKRCALYTRVSTAMQAEKEYNSCDAQKDKILSYVKSQEDLEIFREYSDPGYSGSNLERPALKALLEDISSGQIEVVLTYKIDRLTRSSKDFYTLIDLFEKNGVSYVSVTERFDTSSPSGRLLRNIMLTFAQFEREMTVERIKDKFEQRAQKGMWNGGIPPMGYKNENKKLIVDRKNAMLIRSLFEKFVETSFLYKTLDYVRENKIAYPRSGVLVTTTGLAEILRNPVYAGKTRWGNKVYPGLHEPIISEELFNHAQSLTKEKIVKRPLRKEFLLSQLVKCSECGSGMTNAFTNKKKRRYYYYKCYKVIREGGSACSIKEVNAEKLEEFLIENLSRIASDKQYLENLVYRMLHDSPARSGFELPATSENILLTRVQQVLIDFKNKMQKGTQIEKCLIFQRTITKINFSKEYLEVTISIKDTEAFSVSNGLDSPRL